jgi:hypothetical protein
MNREVMLPQYYRRSLDAAACVTLGASGIRAYDVDGPLQADAWGYCLDAPVCMPCGSLRHGGGPYAPPIFREDA